MASTVSRNNLFLFTIRFGKSGIIITKIVSYLGNRKRCKVKVGDYISSEKIFNDEVQQGPRLFSIFINDIFHL